MTDLHELSRDNPRLLELEAEYAKLNLFEQSVWTEWAKGIDIQNFRAEHGYMAQMWMMTEERYQNTYDYLVEQGLGDQIKRLGEDGAFGVVTFERDGVKFSRDLLDSVSEIQFLEDNLHLASYGAAGPNVLDIGAGYGRLAYRLAQTYPMGAFAFCVDAVPLSTFLCEFYLQYRAFQMEDWQRNFYSVVPLHRLPDNTWPIDIAINCYSFTEMPLSAIDFWLKFCADRNIPYFYLVPHAGDLIHPHFISNDRHDYYPLFEKYGYRLKVRKPRFPEELAPKLIYSTDYCLFERG